MSSVRRRTKKRTDRAPGSAATGPIVGCADDAHTSNLDTNVAVASDVGSGAVVLCEYVIDHPNRAMLNGIATYHCGCAFVHSFKVFSKGY